MHVTVNKSEHACAFECVRIYKGACDNTRTPLVQKRKKKQTEIHTGDFHVCTFTSARLGTLHACTKKKRRNDMLKKLNHT